MKMFYFIEVELMNSIVSISAVWEKKTFFFHILFYYGLSQDIEYSSLCYTVVSYLSILCIIILC